MKLMTTTFPKLERSCSYTHSGELFSRVLLLQENAQNESLVLIVSGKDFLKKYQKISQDLGHSFRQLKSFYDLTLLSQPGHIYIIDIEALDYTLDKNFKQFHFQTGKSYENEEILQQLQDFGYEFSEYEKSGSYNKKGDTLHITTPHEENITLSFWGDEIESMNYNGHSRDTLTLCSIAEFQQGNDDSSILSYLIEKHVFCIGDALQFHKNYDHILERYPDISSFDIIAGENRKHIDLNFETVHCESLESFKEILSDRKKQSLLYTRHSKTLENFLGGNNFKHIPLNTVTNHLCKSFHFTCRKQSFVYICDDILSKIFIKRRTRKKLSADVDLLLKIQGGDYVVHIDHGIGIFQGIVKKRLGNIEKEYLHISYEGEDKLFVPITEIQRVSKYVGTENPKLTPLGGKVWEKKMKKIHEDVREVAQSLLKNFAERKLRPGKPLISFEKGIYTFQKKFPYAYTPDQADAIEDIHRDMLSERNMDRLIVGDVGFGKTEIAFNAAYLALLNKKQVLFLSPLVVLTHEHYAKALERFKDLGVNISILTRLQSQREVTQTLKGLIEGTIHMVIGTHRILSEKTLCKELGLLIVDEEHKFGVVDKEKIKNMRTNIDILSLSATPIPRSLNLALSGVRDISLLKTPPGGRKSIQTSVSPFNEKIIEEAGKREFTRKGQMFFVHNRVQTIEAYKKKLQNIFPKKKIVITHGQLPGDELEDRILAFKEKKYDILLSTTVIENGIDFSNVNTIFINECQSFGISQIHQLRGRVGRSERQGYCYLLYRKDHLDGEAAKRIQTIVDYSYLGAGFELAMKDLEIRGGGDILGVRQSGQAREIGVSLFLKMLEEKIEELKSEQSHEIKKRPCSTQIDLMISAQIDDNYFLSETDKIQFYREIELVESIEDLEHLRQNFFSREEDIPEVSKNLFLLLECKILAQKHDITSIKRVGVNYQIDFSPEMTLERLKDFLTLDSEVKFHVVDISRLRSPTKGFVNDKIFIEYLLRLLQGTITPQKKIRLARKI